MPIPSGATFALIIAAMLVTFGLFFFLIIQTIARLSGWKKLAAEFPARPPAPTAHRGRGSASLGKSGHYNNCLRWTSDDEYLHLRLTPPFSVGHPPISIPWATVEIVYSKARERGLAHLKVNNFALGVPPEALTAELELRKALASSPAAQDTASPYSSDRIS